MATTPMRAGWKFGRPPLKRKFAEREADQQRISHWMAQGKSARDIHKLFEAEGRQLSRQTIDKDMAVVRTEWWQDMRRDLDHWVMEKLAELRALKKEYWDAWFASKGTRATAIKGQGKANDKEWMHAQIREEKSAGNPIYLQGIQWCIQEEARLLGLHAPVQIETFVRWEAERIAKEYGLTTEDVLAEAEAILKGTA
jgi:hypothetical protein